ncbi:MAG TPA: hypothetical protein V6C81_25455 [Planktothrix sp.]|jgi:hypothetical protein
MNLSPRALRFFQLVQVKLGLRSDETSVWRDRRSKYVVQVGETLDEIAHEQLGDSRLARLIVILNRTVVVDETSVLEEGVVLDMPAPREVKNFRNNYMQSKPRSRTGSIGVVSSELHEKPAKDTVITGEPAGPDDDVESIELGTVCRLYSIRRRPDDVQFSIKLQTGLLGSYVTIAAYESFMGKTQRLIYRRDGTCAIIDIDLPAEVAKDMAASDFMRNWQQYYDAYFLPSSNGMEKGLEAIDTENKSFEPPPDLTMLPPPTTSVNKVAFAGGTCGFGF